jgi:hypothetical protein
MCDVSAHLQNTFKKTRFLGGNFRKYFLNAIDQNPKFLNVATFLHFWIVQRMAKNHASNNTIDLH